MASDVIKALIVIGILIIVGLVLTIIGIQHEHLTKLRDRKAELEIMLQDRDKKIEEEEKKIEKLETELSKYDKKRKKARENNER